MLDTFRTLIQRSIYEVIRLSLVELGYTPDITSYANTPAGYASYQADLKAIQVDKGFATELFNQTSPRGKGLKKVPRITLEYGLVIPGDWGSEPTPAPAFQNGAYHYYREGLISMEMSFSCRVVTETTSQTRILNQAVLQALPSLSYVPYYTDNAQTFFTEFVSHAELYDENLNTQESVVSYKVPDIVPEEPTPTGLVSTPIESINLTIANYLGI